MEPRLRLALDAPSFPVRVTHLGAPADELHAELRAATGLGYDADACRWYATQAELDTPHTAFRLDAM